jgi:hypothetical protein
MDDGPGRRRSPRIALSVPIRLTGEGRSCEARTAIVNDHGALIVAPIEFPADATLEVKQLTTGETVAARVVWCGGEDLPGEVKLGIELAAEHPAFWGLNL